MPLPDLPIPANPVALLVGEAPRPGLTGPSPHIYAFDAPASVWSWFGGLVRLRFILTGDGPSNMGVYGTNIPVISGQYGLLRLPPTGDATSYQGTRSPKPGRCYCVVRFDQPELRYTIQIEKA